MDNNFYTLVTAESSIRQLEMRFKENKERAELSAELIIANKELVFQSEDKADRAAELIIANKELAFQSGEEANRKVELIIANKELVFQMGENATQSVALNIANKEIAAQALELIITNKELAFQNEEKSKLASELSIVNKLQGEFFVNMSHELKTPLNVIFSTAQLFDMYYKEGSLVKNKDTIIKYIDSIKQNSYRLSKLINNIVDLSKIETGFFKLNLSNNNIVKVIEEVVMSVTNLTDYKGLNIIFDTDIEEKIIAFDTEKIERVLLNLISNAIKFSEVGDEIFIDVKDKNELVEISVKDNGIGIEEKNLDLIFDRFRQVDKSLSRNAEGSGVGLSIVKSIVELHDGSIYAESELGKWSKFTVMLPSRKVLHENMLYNRNMKNRKESIQMELSDAYK